MSRERRTAPSPESATAVEGASSRAPATARVPELAPYGNAAIQECLGVTDPEILDASAEQVAVILEAVQGARRLANEARLAIERATAGRELVRFQEAFGPFDPERRDRVRGALDAVARGLAGTVSINVDAWHPVTWQSGGDRIAAFVFLLDLQRAHIHLLPRFFQEGAESRASIVFHEAVHKFTGFRDQAYAFEPAFDDLAPALAITNPDSYASYAASRVRDVDRDAQMRERARVVDVGAILWQDYQHGRFAPWGHDDVRLPDGRVVSSEIARLGLVDWLVVNRPDVIEAVEEATDFGEPRLMLDGASVGPELFLTVDEVVQGW